MRNSNPFRELDVLASGFPLFARGLLANSFDSWGVPMNHWRDKNRVHYEFEVPGVKAEDIDVEIDNRVLTVTIDKKLGNVDGERLSTERAYGKVVRQISLGRSVDIENAESSLDGGVLTLSFPITEAKKPRKIEISVGSSQQQIDAPNPDATEQQDEKDHSVAE